MPKSKRPSRQPGPLFGPSDGKLERGRASQPEFATEVQARFDAHKHKVLATIRRDGSARASGIEANFQNGELWFGSMPDSRKSGRPRPRPTPGVALHLGRPAV